MCGRYDIVLDIAQLAARFGATLGKAEEDWQPRYNVAPGQFNPVVVRGGDGRNRLELMQWGLVPAWAKEPKASYSTINARVETVAGKPTFKKALASQRCLVPATGYFEWAKIPGGKQPYRITMGSSEQSVPFAFAGLFDIWRGEDGESLESYTILTTQASEELERLHERMPLILARDAEHEWLDPKATVEEALALLREHAEKRFEAYPVSTLVNSPANEGPEVIEEWDAHSHRP